MGFYCRIREGKCGLLHFIIMQDPNSTEIDNPGIQALKNFNFRLFQHYLNKQVILDRFNFLFNIVLKLLNLIQSLIFELMIQILKFYKITNFNNGLVIVQKRQRSYF